MCFQSKLNLIETDKVDIWELGEDLIYKGREDLFIVPKGFHTDLASVPKILWSIIPSHGLHSKAAVVHDYIYRTKIVSRADADGIFRRIMKENEVGLVRRGTMWAAVRLFGWSAWK